MLRFRNSAYIRLSLLIIGICSPTSGITRPTTAAEAAGELVRLRDFAPRVVQDIRYATPNNFTGRRVEGYLASECLVRRRVALALARTQAELVRRGFILKVYDCYRPRRAVQYLLAWAQESAHRDEKSRFFPNVRRGQLVSQGYIAPHSNHARGIAVDVTLVQLGAPNVPKPSAGTKSRPCTGPQRLPSPDDGVDMGSEFDCFDPSSEANSFTATGAQRARRTLLREVMARHGFRNYPREWWHFTYRVNPLPATLDEPVR